MFLFSKKPAEAARLCFDTDIHCHLVPGVDDGASTPQESVELIKEMKKWGIKRIIASPHVTQNTFENSIDTIEPAMAELKHELSAQAVEIDIDHSAEYRIDELFMRRLEEPGLMMLPDDYILIENSFMQEPWNLSQLVFDLQVRGLRPILAHPERYSYYYNKKERYDELHQAGLAFQINLLSLAGAYGKAEQKVAQYLISKGYVDFIGSDIHNMRHIDAINAYLLTKQAHKDMEALAPMIRNSQIGQR